MNPAMKTSAADQPGAHLRLVSDRADAGTVGIKLSGVSKTYRSRDGDVPSLRPLDFEISEGEFFVVVGPSGANLGAALFCPQDAAVIELSYEPMARAYYFQGASSAGALRHLKVVGRPAPSGEPSHRWAFHAPVPALADALAFALG